MTNTKGIVWSIFARNLKYYSLFDHDTAIRIFSPIGLLSAIVYTSGNLKKARCMSLACIMYNSEFSDSSYVRTVLIFISS